MPLLGRHASRTDGQNSTWSVATVNEKHAIEHSASASGQVRVFVLDPDPYAAAAVRSSMGELGYPCEVMATVDDAINALRSVGGGVLVADLGGRDRDLVDLLRSVRAASPRSAVIASGADITATRAIEWIRAGAIAPPLKSEPPNRRRRQRAQRSNPSSEAIPV